MRTDGQADMTELVVAFRNFLNASKKWNPPSPLGNPPSIVSSCLVRTNVRLRIFKFTV